MPQRAECLRTQRESLLRRRHVNRMRHIYHLHKMHIIESKMKDESVGMSPKDNYNLNGYLINQSY